MHKSPRNVADGALTQQTVVARKALRRRRKQFLRHRQLALADLLVAAGPHDRRRVVGPAFTFRFVPAREDLATPASWGSPISTRAAIEEGEAIPARDYIAALDWADVLYAGLSEIFERCDAILCPAAPGPALAPNATTLAALLARPRRARTASAFSMRSDAVIQCQQNGWRRARGSSRTRGRLPLILAGVGQMDVFGGVADGGWARVIVGREIK